MAGTIHTCPGCGYIFATQLVVPPAHGTSVAEFVTCPYCCMTFRHVPSAGATDTEAI